MSPLSELGGGLWRVDSGFSSVTFSVRHLGVRDYRAGFRDIAGALDGDTGALELSVRLDSLDLNQPEIRARLLSGGFLAADEHPEVRFEAEQLTAGEAGRDVVAAGRLTLRGVTRDVEARGRVGLPGVALLTGANQVTLELAATIDRRDFGVNWQEDLPGGGPTLSDEVTIEAVLEFAQEG